MIVRRFLEWSLTANATARAEAATALAQAYLHSELSPEDFRQAGAALTALLDDAAPCVRRALAAAFASATEAPGHIVVALAHDQGDIAALVLARSPLLAEADLIDCAAVGDALAQCAIALRPGLPETVAAALCEIGDEDAVIALLRNRSARITAGTFMRMIERFGDSASLRDVLLARSDLPVEARQAVVVAVSRALGDFVTGRNWMRPERAARVVSEAREAATIALDDADREADHLVHHLRATGQLTAGFILRALLSGRIGIFTAAMAELSGLKISRVAAILGDRRAGSFRALYAKAGLPESLAPAFGAAIAAWHEGGDGGVDEVPGLSRRMVERVLTALDGLPGGETDKLLALMRRFEAEAARADARMLVEDLIAPRARIPAQLVPIPHAA